jgi:hypothetical protein
MSSISSLRKHKKRQEKRALGSSPIVPRHALSMPTNTDLLSPSTDGDGDSQDSSPHSPAHDLEDSVGDASGDTSDGKADRTGQSAMRLNKIHHDHSSERRRWEVETDVSHAPSPPYPHALY